MSIRIRTVASRVFLSDQRCPVALILQVLKAGNVSYQLYPLLLYSDSCTRWWHTQIRTKLTFREKQAIWMLKEKRKSIRALAKTKGMKKSRFWNHLRHQQPTTTWSAEKTTVVDDRKIIKAVKMNLKNVSVKSPTTSRKLGWCSDNLLSSGDFDTQSQMLHSKMQTSDQHQK